MSSRASFVSVPSANNGDALGSNFIMQVNGGKYEATPVAVADGEARGFLVDQFGRTIISGLDADNAPLTGRPIPVAGQYNLASPTYADGDVSILQTTVNGFLIVTDAVLAALDKGAGSVTGNTLRVQPTVEALANVYEIQGDAADNAVASGNPVRTGGIYNLALPTYGNGDAATLQQDVNGYLLVRDPVVASFSKNAGAADADTLRVVISSDSSTIVRGQDADGAAPTVNPIAIAGVYDNTLPTLVDGRQGHFQLDNRGRLYTNVAVLPEVDMAGMAILHAIYNDYASVNLPGNATAPLQLVASLSANVKKVSVWDTGGSPFELMIGAATVETRKMVFGPGADGEYEVDIPSGTRVSVRRLDSASALAVGDITINFLG